MRDTTLRPETLELILIEISDGKTIRQACNMFDVARMTFWNAVQGPEWSGRYAQARERCLDSWADDIVHDASAPALDAVDVARNKLMAEKKQWVLSKLRPDKYAERQTNVHTGPDGGPIKTETTVTTRQARAVLDTLLAPGAVDAAAGNPSRH